MHVCCIPLHIPILIKVVSEEGSGHSPLEGIATPFPAGTTDCIQDDLFSSTEAGRAPQDSASHTGLCVYQIVSASPLVPERGGVGQLGRKGQM